METKVTVSNSGRTICKYYVAAINTKFKKTDYLEAMQIKLAINLFSLSFV